MLSVFGSPEREESQEIVIPVTPTDILEIESSAPNNAAEEMYEDGEGYFGKNLQINFIT